METLRVLTWNVGSLFEKGWTERRHEIVAWIDQLMPDVICLQEVWEDSSSQNTAAWLGEAASGQWHHAFGGFDLAALGFDDPKFRFGSAVLSRWPIDNQALHQLPVAANHEDAFVEIMGWELLHVQTAGLDLFSTHLAPAPIHGRHRLVQVDAIEVLTRAARGASDRLEPGVARTAMPAILCGDFNAEPNSDEIRFLRGLTPLNERTTFWQDAWSVAGDGSPGYTQDWRTHPLADALNVHRKRIDYIFVGDPFLRAGNAGRVLSCEVIGTTAITGLVGSDHSGLLAEVVWPSRP